MKNKKIIAADFDGCLVTNKYPEIGEPIEKNIRKLKEEQSAGAKVILWTNRRGDCLKQAVDFCNDHGIRLDAVNANLPEIIEAFGGDTRKIFATEYWDDRAVLMSEQNPAENGQIRSLDTLLVAFDHTHDDITVLIVARKNPGKAAEIINQLQREEAEELYRRLVGFNNKVVFTSEKN